MRTLRRRATYADGMETFSAHNEITLAFECWLYHLPPDHTIYCDRCRGTSCNHTEDLKLALAQGLVEEAPAVA